MIVRNAKPKDFNEMGMIFKQVDELHSIAHPDIFNPPILDARSKEYLESVIKNDKSKLLVAVEDNQIIGIAKADIESAPNIPLFVQRNWISISTIVVDKNHRGKGVGKKLLSHLYEWAKMQKVYEVELTVFSFNESAINFYENNGFTTYRTKMHKKLDS